MATSYANEGFVDDLLGSARSRFRLTAKRRDMLTNAFENSLRAVSTTTPVKKIVDAFIDLDFIGGL